MKDTRTKKAMITLAVALSLALVMPTTVSAMHIMEGYLRPEWCIAWGAACIPFVVMGFFSIKKAVGKSSKNLILLAMCGAFAFVLSALKIPSVTGSCSHPTGVGLGAILFGPSAMAVIGAIILLFQALLLAHGGLTTLGANTFSMAIVGPFAAFGAFILTKFIIKKVCKNPEGKTGIAVFAAAFVGDIITYMVTSFQLAMAYPDPTGGFGASLAKFMGIFAVTQLPLAVCEGLLTVVVYNVLAKYSKKELQALSVL